MLLYLLLLVMTQPPLEPAHIPTSRLPFFFFFCGCPVCFLGFLILLSEQYLYSNLRTMSLTQCFWAFNSNVGTMLVADVFGLSILLTILCLPVYFPALSCMNVISVCFVACPPSAQGFV